MYSYNCQLRVGLGKKCTVGPGTGWDTQLLSLWSVSLYLLLGSHGFQKWQIASLMNLMPYHHGLYLHHTLESLKVL